MRSTIYQIRLSSKRHFLFDNSCRDSYDEKHVIESEKIRREADALLAHSNIFETLARFGRLEITGSYFYNLMTWRDIDLCLVVSRPDPGFMMKIGNELARIKGLATMYYRNEFVLKTPGNPKGMFWCLEIMHRKKLWKIDILVASKNIVEKVMAPGRVLKKKLTPESRETILKLKMKLCKLKEYRRKFKSTDIYDAVLIGRVKTLREWGLWKRARK